MTGLRLVRLLLACGLLLTCSVSAAAQGPGPRDGRWFGLTIGYPSGSTGGPGGGLVGLVWQTSGRTAFRPEISFGARFAGENTSGTSTATGVTVTVIRYLAGKDGFRAYWGPRLSYSRSTTSGLTADTTNSSYGVGPSFGVQYELTRRIAVYGEVGALYTYARATSTNTMQPAVSSHLISSRSSLGLNLYF